MLGRDGGAGPARLGLVGATGRMGQRVWRLLAAYPQLRLDAVLLRPGAAPAPAPPGCEAPRRQTADLARFAVGLDVVLDFSAPACCAALAPHLAAANAGYVLASTGLGDADEAALVAAAARIPIVQAANLSLGVDVMREVVTAAARRLGHWDIEIVETHHRHKKDGPSGTAYALGDAVLAGAGPLAPVLDRHAESGGRAAGTLGYSVVRGGDVAGEHTVVFFGTGERLEITHRSQDASIFARGALDVGLGITRLAPGRYAMADVLPKQPN